MELNPAFFHYISSLIEGVVSRKKYAYNIWESTVNVTSRMESAGEAGKVSAKNVGEIDMYFVESEM